MLKMPDIDKDVMARRVEIATALREIVPGEGVITEETERRAYETDGLTAYKQLPMIVVLPETTEQVSQVLRYCNENKIRVVPRGAGPGTARHNSNLVFVAIPQDLADLFRRLG